MSTFYIQLVEDPSHYYPCKNKPCPIYERENANKLFVFRLQVGVH